VGRLQAHFVEADPWVVSHVLGKNIASCGAEYHTTVHTQYVEPFLRRVAESPDVRPVPFRIPLFPPGVGHSRVGLGEMVGGCETKQHHANASSVVSEQ
jgi:hypothetical protein